ncbi:glucosylglycerol 3-phosphatase [Myxosarcina sp. GI1]|uniref:glucosylglycerol 3-phosphatase n=1 Tax=Myxosarcina sp. GI1 TaxID=1541065 RepID=UPI00056464F8|nr:glucosylglycerol 3-phosphatase [Myxosarcina sp. GI1]
MTVANTSLDRLTLSLEHEALVNLLAQQENILIIQDLDGVCMGLVKDPLTRVVDARYLEATTAFEGHFFVLTNGEHIGKRGVNRIVEKTLENSEIAKQQGLYLPGLAAGGVQWQDRYGNVTHPGVSEAEMSFLDKVPQKLTTQLKQVLSDEAYGLEPSYIETWVEAAVLDNPVSPTANINVFYEGLSAENYRRFQQEVRDIVEELLQEAQRQGLSDSFFIHYAPNLGRDAAGKELIRWAKDEDSGTTDFQFMLRGGIKEAGVLSILNRYYYSRTGNYPLGKDFNSRQAPQQHLELLKVVTENFEPQIMPTIVGVGDTVTSVAEEVDGELTFGRGGSDRGFLELVQAIGREFDTGNVIVYVDSSGGEVKNRKPLKLQSEPELKVIEGPGDKRDTEDPLTLNVVFPEGHRQYIDVFAKAAQQRVGNG